MYDMESKRMGCASNCISDAREQNKSMTLECDISLRPWPLHNLPRNGLKGLASVMHEEVSCESKARQARPTVEKVEYPDRYAIFNSKQHLQTGVRAKIS